MYSGSMRNKRKLIDTVEIGAKGGRTRAVSLSAGEQESGPERSKDQVGCLLSASSGNASGQEGPRSKESRSAGAGVVVKLQIGSEDRFARFEVFSPSARPAGAECDKSGN
jgi:hypothetical protein